jgi:zinc D-Ala-D-Ala carboxypeptidase
MKISRFICLTIIIIVIAILWLDESNAPTTLNQEQWGNGEETIKLTIHPEDVHKGNLVLVNQEYGIKENNVKKDLINLFENQNLIADYGLLDKNIRLSKEVMDHFNTMVEAAKKDGVTNFLISSGYRSFKNKKSYIRKWEKNLHYQQDLVNIN